jgi:hypothetical protein
MSRLDDHQASTSKPTGQRHMDFFDFSHVNDIHHFARDNDNMFFSDYAHQITHHASDSKFLGGICGTSPDQHPPMNHTTTLFRDELMTEEPIHDWNALVNMSDVPMLHTNNNLHHQIP